MPKVHYFSNKFSKIAKRWGLCDFGDLKLRDAAKFCYFKLITTKSNFKKSVMTSFWWRYGYYVTEKRHKIFPICSPTPPPPIKISGYAWWWCTYDD